MMTVAVTSRDTIKPSSPTPPHLRTHQLSWLDQHAPLSHIPVILFYSTRADGGAADSLPTLKRSLSETLTLFHPLAGRLNPSSLVVDCNDQGIDLFEARADAPLSQLLQQAHPDLDALSQLLPCSESCGGSGSSDGPLLSLQITVFSCSSMAIGVCVSHKIADGLSVSNFITAWAAAARGSAGEVNPPTFDAASLFPPSSYNAPAVPVWNLRPSEKLATRRFVFDESKIALLRKSGLGSPTRFEAVAALIWRCSIRARGESGSDRASVALVAINLRKRAEPPLPDSLFGNISTRAVECEVGQARDEGAKIRTEEKLRSAIRKIDGEHVRLLQGVDGPLFELEKSREAGRLYGKTEADAPNMDFNYITSWFRFPVYEADFGWGKPVWVSTARRFWKNLVFLMGRGADEGMEAWVTLKEEEMAAFERDEELISIHASPAPSKK